MHSPRSTLIELIEQGAIPVQKIGDALIVTHVVPTGRSWRTFIDHLLLGLGGLALAFAVMFFIAFNWEELGRFAKFGMVAALMILAILSYCKFGEESATGKVSMLVATILLGGMLSLYGQTYQTGADSWQLFFTWALLMLPWAIIGRFPVIWILWVLLINISIVLYYQTFQNVVWGMLDSSASTVWRIFFFNILALAVWELLAGIWDWLAEERWAIRFLAVGSGLPLTWLVLFKIFDGADVGTYTVLVWTIWLALLYLMYRKIRPDLFMLAGGCLSGITVTISFVAYKLLRDLDAGGFLALTLLVVGMGAAAAFWLKKVHQEFQS